MGKCSNAFFSETTNMIKAKLYRNVHWMVLYNLKVFCSDMKFKMAATAGLSLTLDPMGKMFQNASSLKPLGQLKPNCPGIIIWRSSKKFGFFMPIRNAGHILLTQDYMGKYRNILSETTELIEPKLYMDVLWMVLYKIAVFRSSLIFKMAARANNVLWLADISKFLFSESNELTEPKLYMNDHWKVLYQVTVFFYVNLKSKMAAYAGHSFNTVPYWKI